MRGDVVTSAGISQDADSLSAVERAAQVTPPVSELLAHDAVTEALVLHTCHRVELYVVTDHPAAGRQVLETVDLPHARIRDHESSLRHLLRVAAGLESMVLGEDQVLGQVRDAYETARTADGIGPVLEDAVTKAIRVGERARTETAINEGVVSLGSAAVRLAERETTVANSTAMVVGAGEMGRLAATALGEQVDRLIIANRTVERARSVADDVATDTVAVGLDAIEDHLASATVVVTATARSGPVVTPEVARGVGETVIIDLANPPDVADLDAEAVRVFDYEDLEAVTDRTHERRRAAAQEVRAIVEEEFDRLLDEFKRKRADEVIAAMYESAEELKRREVETAISRLESQGELSADQRAVVESLADALVSQILAAPTRSLREAAANDDWSTISTALTLFDPDFSEPSGTAPGLSDLASGDEGAMPESIATLLAAAEDPPSERERP